MVHMAHKNGRGQYKGKENLRAALASPYQQGDQSTSMGEKYKKKI
jgi:hypothetical protein